MHLMLLQRFKLNGPATGAKQQWNIWMTNLALVGLTWLFVLVAGWKSVFLIYYPAMYLAGAFGIWLFYVQHQFEEAYWERGQQWDYATAAITGSSHLRLPAWMNWFTGHIGLHHVHHLGPRSRTIGSKRARGEPDLHQAAVITFWTAWHRSVTLWDEKRTSG
jgi:omega-6 fatty acid desaturase (delta-12 desaturase)